MANLQDLTNRSEVGAIKPWGKSTAPAGYVLCDGTAISRTTYADLYTVIGTTYGVGDGSSTFNVPDLQGKMPQGYDGSTYNLAGTGGANTVTVSLTNNQSITNNQTVSVTGSIDNTSLTTAQLASHSHTVSTLVGDPINTGPLRDKTGSNRNAGDGFPTNSAGSGTGHNHTHTLAGALSGTVALGGTVTGSGTNTFSPYVVVNYIIKH